MQRLMVVLFLAIILSLSHPAPFQGVETFPGDSLSGWSLTDFAGGTPPGATLSVEDEHLVVRYDRATLMGAVHSVLLTELQEIRLAVASEQDVDLRLVIEDRDGALFQYAFSLTDGKPATVRVRPADFRLSQDSPVRRSAMDPTRLGEGYALVDPGKPGGGNRANRLSIQGVEIEREALLTQTGPLVVSRSMEIRQSQELVGDIVVVRGGRLRITAPRFVLRGNLQVEENGSVEMRGGVVEIPQRFNHERGMAFAGWSQARLRDVLVASAKVPFGLVLRDRSSLVVQNTRFSGGMTVDVSTRSSVQLDRAMAPGEFILVPGARMTVTNSRALLLWFTLSRTSPARLSFPPGATVTNWMAPRGYNVRVRDSRDLSWALISTAGAKTTVSDSELMAVGLVFKGSSRASFRQITNHTTVEDFVVPATDRSLRFRNCRVGAWNFYAGENAQITLDRSVFGEVLTYDDARVEATLSTCDGSGGYVGANDRSQIRMSHCIVDSLAVARHSGTMELTDCAVNGDVYAADQATVRLIRTPVNGRIDADPEATLVQE